MAITIDTRDARGLGRTDGAAASLAERARGFAAARRHSRLVRLFRLALPLAALGVLVTYVLMLAVTWQLNAGRLRASGIELTADDLTMKEPSYFGVTSDGGQYRVRARRAVVAFNQSTPMKLIDISGDLAQTNNVTTKLKAKHGLFDNAKGELELYDGIEIDASNGLLASLSRATVYSKEGRVVSKHPVSANMPAGSVQAAAMTMDTKSRLVQFRGTVAVRLLPTAQQSIGTGRDARQPLDVYAEELDVDDAQKTAHFRGNVIARQGETVLSAPYLFLKYEGKAAAALGSPASPSADPQAARVTFLWARNGVELSVGTDRRITSDLADFDVTADTALFAGNVTAKQDKDVLRGGRLFVERKAGRSLLETPAEGNQPPGRIAGTFHQGDAGAQAPKPKPKAAAADAAQELLFGSFKTDPGAPMEIEANTVEMHEAGKKAVFSGNVKAQQGDFVVRTVELTAFYTGQAGLGLGNADAAGRGQGQITRIEAKRKVLITSKDDQNAVSDWANFDVKANTALLGGGVVVMRGKEIAEGPLLKIDLTTGMYRFESEGEPAPPKGGAAISASPPATSSSSAEGRSCPPGKQCVLIYPKDAKEKAKELLKKTPAAPLLDGPAVR